MGEAVAVTDGSGPIALSHWQLKNRSPADVLIPVNAATTTNNAPPTAASPTADHAMNFMKRLDYLPLRNLPWRRHIRTGRAVTMRLP
ncbi:hypothetical protein, partial [Nocardia farcinica]|uniref:hypothetical protein n=1 Tax=Nocardia farcinica TaxID=37329 RepID=UPI0034DB0EF4